MPCARVTIVRSPSARVRRDASAAWLAEQAPDARAAIVATSLESANGVGREACSRRPATFGLARTTATLFFADLARKALARRGLVFASRLSLEAVCARLVATSAKALGRFAQIAGKPGFPRALVRTLEELRLDGVPPDAGTELLPLLRAYEAALGDLGLADRAATLGAARGALLEGAPIPRLLALVDLPLWTRAERDAIAALEQAASALFITVPVGDPRTERHLREAFPHATWTLEPGPKGPLTSLQRGLFSDTLLETGGGDAVVILSAPGESRECVEIARRIVSFAKQGVPFDRMAVLLRSAPEYAPHLVEALRRARVPAYFARGLRLPDPSGRALLALLACAADGLSARRFAEYLSLGEVPRTEQGAPPAAPSPEDRWVPADEEVAEAMEAKRGDDDDEEDGEGDDDEEPVRSGTLRAPRRWEQLLVEAAVIGGLDRWKRRLRGLAEELRSKCEVLASDEDPRAAGLERDLATLADLERFAIPLLCDLAALPREAPWREWLERLTRLATRGLRRPKRVLAVLSELWPMADASPVDLTEVRLVLEPRLADTRTPQKGRRLGRVYVAGIEEARGLTFEVVFSPGLAEKSFPRKVTEDPLMLDAARRLHEGDLATNVDRAEDERLMLRLAAGAAERTLLLSYPRIDAEVGRPRTPSFYGLEVLRVVLGRLPGYEDLKRRADLVSQARIGWPAPRTPDVAIDDAEHDLALLGALLGRPEDENVGAARFLLKTNVHLTRALYARAYRWRKGKFVAQDGLVDVPDEARAALAKHSLQVRSYSPTALQNYAACPYRFYLSAMLRLSPREEPAPLEELDPLQRGTLVHEAQFALHTRLRALGLLPITAGNIEQVGALLDETLDAVARDHEDRLCPAIDRIWDDGLAQIRADLREWLRRAPEDATWVPSHFELSFGLVDNGGRDTASHDLPAELDSGLKLRGSIDLVERRADGVVRATDYQTGKVRAREGIVIDGGEILQPVFYALALEKLLPGTKVEGGRLYYCTAVGSYTTIPVPLDAKARDAAGLVTRAVGEALEKGFLPAAPSERACTYCDFKAVCGPHEELRVATKRPARALSLLNDLREAK